MLLLYRLSAFTLAFLVSSVSAYPTSSSPVAPLEEQRYCGTPTRYGDGSIKRRSDVLVAFQRIHPCPSTGKTTGTCPGYAKDHIIPLACGGCDSVSNLQWLPNQLKSAAGAYPKDRWERRVYCEKSDEK